MTQLHYDAYTRNSDHLFKTIKKVAENVGKTTLLIENSDLKQNLINVLDKLAEIDRDLDGDVKTIEKLKQFEADNNTNLKKKFSEIRKNINTETLGRCYAKIDEIKRNVTATPSNSQLDESVEMEMLSMIYSEKDPISKKPITDPVKNSICGHVYDKASVEAYIAQCKKFRQLCQCPVSSCPNKQVLQMARMTAFPEFWNLIRRNSTARK